MSDKWENYFGDRVMCVSFMGIKLIRPANMEIKISIACSICGFLMRGMEDGFSHEEYECCQECAYKWAQPNRLKWKEGWRPTSIEKQKYLDSIMNQPTIMVR